MTSPEDAIRARRKLTNRLIAAHEAARLAPFFDPDCLVVAGDGSRIEGRAAVIEAFTAQFAAPGFGAYVRTTTEVRLDTAGLRAAEAGTWIATGSGGAAGPSGVYLAVWRKATGQWVVESELYVTLADAGA